MKTFTAGPFTLDITSFHPMWVTIYNSNDEKIRCRHDDLVDLKHIIERAIAEVERRMPGESK